ARLLAEIDGKRPDPSSRLIFWRQPPADHGKALFATFTLPADRDEAKTANAPIYPESWQQAFAGKIVLIGGAFSDRDQHLTPLDIITRTPRHGVDVHAQLLAQLRDGRSMYELAPWQEILVAAIITYSGFFAARRWSVKSSACKYSFFALLALLAVGGLLY